MFPPRGLIQIRIDLPSLGMQKITIVIESAQTPLAVGGENRDTERNDSAKNSYHLVGHVKTWLYAPKISVILN